MDDRTPVVIGVGEASERIDAPDFRALSPADLAGRAARAACDDALSAKALAPHIDVIAAIRQFEVSGPRAVAPFGRADNFPRAVAARIGADPARAVLEVVGGQGPQHLVNEFAHAIAAGEASMVLLTGSEAISTIRHLASRGESRDWSETHSGSLEDRGFGDPLLGPTLPRHGARTAISLYALAENARRARLGLSRDAYRARMAALFAPFTKVAAANPHAMSRQVFSTDELATIDSANRLTSDPFPRRLVARDQANQGAAVLLTSVGRARALGVPEDRWIFLHGGADARERDFLERADLGAGPASILAAQAALAAAGADLADIAFFDFYSCFPIAVFNVRDGLGLAEDDPRPLTVTGGLPFFGGAGNNYSMHAIAAMARRLRAAPEATGLVAANGGFLSKYSVGVYSARPAPWRGFDSGPLQREVDGWAAPTLAPLEPRAGVVETYTIDYAAGSSAPPTAVVIGRRDGDGARFVAMSDGQTDVAARMASEEPLGARVSWKDDGEGHAVIAAFTPAGG